MSDLKRVGARAFCKTYHALDPKKEGTNIKTPQGRQNVRLTRLACLQCLWENSFVTTKRGRLCMQAALRAVLEKWDDISYFYVPVTVENQEPYYEVTTLLYMLIIL